MTIEYFYRAADGGFYNSKDHKNTLPDGCKPISEEAYRSLLASQTEGKQIVPGDDGLPVTKTVVRTPAEKMEGVRRKRNRILNETDWTQMPDAPVDKVAWLNYRQALRDLPQNYQPDDVIWPTPPA